MSSKQRTEIVAKEIVRQRRVKPRKEVSAVHLLREHIPAEGDAALQGDCGEVRTLSAFRFRPGPHGRNNPSKRGPQEIQEAEIGSDRLDAVAVFRALRTELQKLHHALEIITGSDPLDARNVLDLGRENSFRGRSDERAAIRDKKLQQRCR